MVFQFVGEILLAINAPIHRGKSINSGISKFLAPLSALSQASWRLTLPGAIRAYSEGEFPCASLPLSNWLRLRTGESGALPSIISELPTQVLIDEIIPIRHLNPDNTTYALAKESWIAITKLLGKPKEENDDSTDFLNVERSNREVRSNARKKKILSGLYKLLNDTSTSFPPIGQLIAVWAIHLCHHGTSHMPVIRANSVTRYVRAIGERLIALAYEEDFLTLPDFIIEEFYRKVLQSSTSKNRLYVASRLLSGFYAAVLQPGSIRPGDPILLLEETV